MGPELFDHAFRTYSQRWMFKHPAPADFFRTMEDASGVDLDWFWRGWFYTTEYVDQSLDYVRIAAVPTLDPATLEAQRRAEGTRDQARHIGQGRNEKELRPTVVDATPAANDFYNSYDRYPVSAADAAALGRMEAGPSGYLHEIKVSNKGGLIMPVIVAYTFEDGSQHVERWPAEVWLKHEENFTKVVYLPKKAVKIELDPFLETADTDTYNNTWPADVNVHLEALPERSRWESWRSNPMRDARNNQ